MIESKFGERLRSKTETAQGGGAFYDLDVEGHQAKLATDISKGQKCVVATPQKNRDIAFEWLC